MAAVENDSSPPYDEAAPSPSAMLESLRGIGYTTATAIADLIDNSIAAGASRVRVDFIWRGEASMLRIHDNGRGMDRAGLIEAMRPAGRHPLAPREPGDLGRFGLGLKTASLSQGRLLAVISKVAGGAAEARHWDLSHLEIVNHWHLLRGMPEALAPHAAIIDQYDSGTVVIVSELDRMLGGPLSDNPTDRGRFESLARQVESHLAMTFHRYIEGSAPRLVITFNGNDQAAQVLPWDPFVSSHAATTPTPVETIHHNGRTVEIQGFVLPHRDRLGSVDFERAEGPSGWQVHEGFFVYRGHRLLVAGGWLGLGPGRGWAQNGLHRLARIRLDLPTSGDQDWKVDIRKSSAVPPPALRARLQTLADAVRRDAREIFAHRAGSGSRQKEKLVRAWTPVHSAQGITYKIDRSHPSIKQALDAVGAKRRQVEEMLSIIEATVPVQRIWMDASEAADSPAPVTSAGPSLEERSALQSLFVHMRGNLGLTVDDAKARLLGIEPFSAYPDIVLGLSDVEG